MWFREWVAETLGGIGSWYPPLRKKREGTGHPYANPYGEFKTAKLSAASCPPFAKNAKDGAPTLVVMSARSKAWATRRLSETLYFPHVIAASGFSYCQRSPVGRRNCAQYLDAAGANQD